MSRKEISGGVVHRLPADFKKALAADSAALAKWEGLTPLTRNEWICWVESVKKPETRQKHIARVCPELKGGIRRPCCWSGCVHRTDKTPATYLKTVRTAFSRRALRGSGMGVSKNERLRREN